MAEILYQYRGEKQKSNKKLCLRWLKEETEYAVLFFDDKMIARACIEKYSENYWEVGDVRVVRAYRNQGYAYEICLFVMNEILGQGKIPTIRTEETNESMKRVIRKLGFSEMDV